MLLSWILIVVVFIGAGIWWFYHQMRKPGVLNARIHLFPSGEHDIEFDGEASDDNLALLALTYGAKLHWLLKGEASDAEQLFNTLTLAAAAGFVSGSESEDTDGSLKDRVPTRLWIQDPDGETPVAADDGEEYAVRFHQAKDGSGWIANDLPGTRMKFNLAWHYFLLLDAVHSRLSRNLHSQFGNSLNAAREMWKEQQDRSRSTFKRMTAAANESWSSA